MNCEQMDKLMSESRKRKTRRGKKNSLKSLKRIGNGVDSEKGQFKRFSNVLSVTKSNRRKGLRPASNPPAPSNTTQFLIEDREELALFDTSLEIEPLDEVSFYDNNNNERTGLNTKTESQDSYYYEPLWTDCGDDDFMSKEFEKDYNAAANLENFSLMRLHEDFTKEELVRRIMDMENQYATYRQDYTEAKKSSTSFEKLFTDLKSENARLKEENKQLRSALLL